MKRTIAALLTFAALGCGGTEVTEDAGVDAGVEDGGPTRDTIPAPPPLSATTFDRAGRPYVAELLLGATATTAAKRQIAREAYNRGTPTRFTAGSTLALASPDSPGQAVLPGLTGYDALDGACGEGNLTSRSATLTVAYGDLAGLIAEDMIWLDTDASRTRCDSLLAVERRALGLAGADDAECGGRAPHVDALDEMLWLITSTAARDGVRASSADTFTEALPFTDAP